ncbi:DUF58 domain-containing protein [Halobaculum sp. D14]|uniref:DUF58 domain-containing protein n=1 Tax=unclassified Halobaculum TaxID=2640896 RepID=UPI003EBB71BA
MRLTRRGKAVVVAVAVAVGSAALFGPRGLNAAVIPGGIALGAAYVQLRRAEAPRAARDVPPDDHVGRSHRVRLFFGDRGGPRPDEEHGLRRPFSGAVRERVGDGVDADPAETRVDTVVGAVPVEYDVTYESRGRHTLGPATVTARDVLGLAETELSTAETATVLVYPRVHAIAGWARRDLRALHETGVHEERREFDRLREYARGDSLRDVHWKSTAKRQELIVKEFAAEAETEAVSIAAGAAAEPGAADGMAEAVASLALALVADGVPVEVALPDGDLRVGAERGTQVRLLERLAVAGAGRLADADADITVYGERDRVRVDVGDGDTDFADLTAAHPPTYGVSRPADAADGAAAADSDDAEVAA